MFSKLLRIALLTLALSACTQPFAQYDCNNLDRLPEGTTQVQRDKNASFINQCRRDAELKEIEDTNNQVIDAANQTLKVLSQ